MSENLLVLKGISKQFPGVKALSDVCFSIRRGDVHGIIGENGAGKSTLIKILSGAQQKDEGQILFDGQEAHIRNSHDAKSLGIGTIYQEMSLVPTLNAVDNIFLGEEQTQGCVLNKSEMRRRTQEAMNQLNVHFSLSIPVKHLSTAQQQMIEIARGLVFQRKLIIMDEPTSSLSQKDVADLFRVISLLKQRGVTIIYISHKMEELQQISDRLTVMRDGCVVDTVRMQETTIQHIIKLMVGRDFDTERKPVPRDISAPPVLEARHISDYNGKVKDVSFKLPKGIILGFAGLVGAGRTELMRMIFGADPMSSGEVVVKGVRQKKLTTENSVQNGVAYLSEDRKFDGLLLRLPIRQNITVANLSRISHKFLLDRKLENSLTEPLKNEVRIVTPSLERLALNLSGGNQQKVAIAKWLFTQCDILIFDEPTRGIDVGARSEIYELMNKLVDGGKSIILVSSDLVEVLALSNVIITMHEGEISGEIVNDGTITQDIIMKQMLGGFGNAQG